MTTFEFDPAKATLNVTKHGVSFDLAKAVWDDPLHVVFTDRIVDGEQRYHAVGLAGGLILLVVVHMYPLGDGEDHVRIIGARRATRHERRRYEEGST